MTVELDGEAGEGSKLGGDSLQSECVSLRVGTSLRPKVLSHENSSHST